MATVTEQVTAFIEGYGQRVKEVFVSAEQYPDATYRPYISTESRSASGKIFKVVAADYEEWEKSFKATAICPAFPPQVGDGMTECFISDRYGYTVVDKTPTGHTLYVVADKIKQTGEYFGNQKWEHEPNTDPKAPRVKVRWSPRKERYMANGRVFIFGRHTYQDPSF